MRNTRTLSQPSRRDPLIGEAGDDAELIAVCLALEANERAHVTLYKTITDDDEADLAADPLLKQEAALIDRLDGLRAVTPEGILARARTLAVMAGHGGYCMDIGCGHSGRMVAAFLRDALAMSGLPVHPALRERRRYA